jgi:hypothetical protein
VFQKSYADWPQAKPHASDDEQYEKSDEPGVCVSRVPLGVCGRQCHRLEIGVSRLAGRLLSVRRGGSHLFLRYELERD